MGEGNGFWEACCAAREELAGAEYSADNESML
jgi:hypothetical protein